MFTSRGYRRASKENKNYSRQGQIIQKKPVFQIDNNPVVLDTYKQFILSTMPRLLRTRLYTGSYEIALSDYNLSWSSSDRLPAIQEKLIAFATEVFNRYQALGKYPISLELYAPDLNDYFEWLQVDAVSSKLSARFIRIIIDIKGNFSWVQQNGGVTDYVMYSNGSVDLPAIKLGHNFSSPSYSNPSAMKVDINYFTFYDGN